MADPQLGQLRHQRQRVAKAEVAMELQAVGRARRRHYSLLKARRFHSPHRQRLFWGDCSVSPETVGNAPEPAARGIVGKRPNPVPQEMKNVSR